MILRVVFVFIIFTCTFWCKGQVILQDQLWNNDQFRIIMYRDSTFTFSKIDEPMKDIIGGKWIFRADSFYLFSADEYQILLFALYETDSMHKLITHVDPRIYDSYASVKFPKYFYLNKTYYATGNVCKAYSFASCDETPKCYLDINKFDEKGILLSRLAIKLKAQKAIYVEYSSTPFKMPKVIKKIVYKNGKQVGKIKTYNQ